MSEKRIHFRLDENIQIAETAVFDPGTFVLYFRTVEEYRAWRDGQPLKLITLWTKPAKQPNYR